MNHSPLLPAVFAPVLSGLQLDTSVSGGGTPPPADPAVLMEDGSYLLLEDGGLMLLE